MELSSVLESKKDNEMEWKSGFAYKSEYNKIKKSSYPRRIHAIKRIVASYFSVPIEDIDTRGRHKECIALRQTVMFFVKKHCPKMSFRTIGTIFGSLRPFDHATIIHSLKRVSNLIETDKAYREQMTELNDIIAEEMRKFDEELDDAKNYYFLDMNKVKIMDIVPGKAVVFVGLSSVEIRKLMLFSEEKMSKLRCLNDTGARIIKKK